MSHQDKASRVSIFPLSGRAWWKVFRLHFHYVPFISGASVFPARGVEWPGGRAAPSPSGQKRPKVVAPSPRTSRPPAGPPATTSLSPRPLFRGPAALRGRDGPAFACETCGPRRGEKGHHHRSVSGLLPVLSSSQGGKGGSGKECGPPRASGWGAGHSRSPGAAAPCSGPVAPSVGSAFESEVGSSGGTCFSLTHRKRGL